MPDVLSALIRLFSVQWQGVPVASLAVFAVGGLIYVAMSRSPTSATPQAPACVAPGGLHAGVHETASVIPAATSVSATKAPSAPCI